MNIDLDSDAKALYLRLAPGRVADHGELADLVVANYDAAGRILGIEFVQAEDFGSFVLQHPDLVELPSRLAYTSRDRGRSWVVETGAEAKSVLQRPRLNA